MIGIICALEIEATTIITMMTKIEQKTIFQKKFWHGFLFSHEVVVALSGIGKVEAAVTTFTMFEHFNPQLIISCGIAGGFNEKLTTLDIIVSDKVGYYDVDLTYINHDSSYGQLQDLPCFFPVDLKSLALLKKIRNDNIHFGTIMTADIFAHDRQNLEKCFMKYQEIPDVLAVDMESASIAHICYNYHIPFLSLRTISDVIGAKQNCQYAEFSIKAAQASASVIGWLVKNRNIQKT